MSGPGIDRRTLLRRGALLALGAALPLPLAACGKTTETKPDRSIAFLYAAELGRYPFIPENPPLGDFARLITERAREQHVTLTVYGEGDPRRNLRKAIAPQEYNPATNERAPLFSVVAISVPGMPVDRSVVQATEDHVQLVAFLYPVPHAAVTVAIDPIRMGKMLGEDILAWSARRGAGNGEVLLVEPRPRAPEDAVPFAAVMAPRSAAALRSTLGAGGAAPRIAAAVSPAAKETTAQAVRRALTAHPGVRIVACLDDADATVAAKELAAAHPGQVEDLYVGGLGAPAVSSLGTLKALGNSGCLRALVAASPAALAGALVDCSAGLLHGEDVKDTRVSPLLLRPGSAALRRYAHDYTPGGWRYGPSEYSRPFVLNAPKG